MVPMMPPVRDVVRSAIVWGAFATVVLVAVPPMVLGFPLVLVDPNRAGADRYLRWMVRTMMRVSPSWRFQVEGTRHLALGGPFVLVVNHESMADLVAMCFLGHDAKYLGKQSVFKVPVFGWALHIAGEVPVERGNKESGARALQRLGYWLDRGVSIAIFPEGTRSPDGTIAPFKMGAFNLAVEKQKPIVPIVISGTRDLLPKRSFILKGRANVWVRVLEPISTAGLCHDDVPALAQRVRERMIMAYEELERRTHPQSAKAP
jgi:1-acyl-sn-glycerol-3-phosphate acyltransferase